MKDEKEKTLNKKEETQEILIANFCDIYDIRPVHYDCVLGRIRLPWNNQVIDIFVNYNIEDQYRPVLDGLYAREASGIYLRGDGFSEQDLAEYIKKVQEDNAHTKWLQSEMTRVLSEVYSLIQAKVHKSLMPVIKAPDDKWLLIYYGEYALGYNPETKMFSINKYYAKEPFERRYWWWNKDKDFNTINSTDKEEIISNFITLVKRDMQELANEYYKLLAKEKSKSISNELKT